MYQLTEKINADIKKIITTGTLKKLKDLGLFATQSNEQEYESLLNILADPEKMKVLTNCIFDIKEEIDWDEGVDAAEFAKGYQDFFVNWTRNFGKSAS